MKCYDSCRESKYIIYLDSNNLYGWEMSQYLPYSGFKWLNWKEIDRFDADSICENSSIGYILEVDINHPDGLHELHSDYPLAPEKVEISQNMLSTLGNKNRYVAHYKNLQLYLSLGINLTKVHKISKFKQYDWLKEYNDFDTIKKKNVANTFEKNFLKLMNNSFFEKTMKNLRNRISVTLVNNANDYNRYISKSSFVSQKIFSKSLVAIHEIKPVLTLNKLIYEETSILDFRKLLMYEFLFKYLKSKSDANLLFTDTDSLVYEIKREDVYEDFFKDKNLFHFSDYSLNSKFFDPVNKKIIGKKKDEFKGKITSVLTGLKSKIYSLIAVDSEEVIKTKRMNKNVVKEIRQKEFADVLFNKKIIRHNMKRIQSKLHRIGTYDVCKTSLSCFDDKRYVFDDGINSLAYFHKDIRFTKYIKSL